MTGLMRPGRRVFHTKEGSGAAGIDLGVTTVVIVATIVAGEVMDETLEVRQNEV